MRYFAALLCLFWTATLQAANPAFGSFNTDQFATAGSTGIWLKDGAGLTNTHFSGSSVTFPVGQRFDTTITTNVMGVRDAAGVTTYQINNITGDFLLTGPVGIIMTVTQAQAVVWFGLPVFGNGYGLSNLVTVASNTVTISTNARTFRFWGAANVTNNDGVEDIVFPPSVTAGITNDTSQPNGYVKTVTTPTLNVYSDGIYSVQDWYSSDGTLIASVGYNPADGTSKYGHFSLFGTATSAYGNVMGFDIWNTNLNAGAVASDRRVFVFRNKDPGGTNTANWVNRGNYALFESRYSPNAPDFSNGSFDLTFANFLMCDENGNVGIGDLGQRSDDPAQGMLHPWAKTTLYGSYLPATSTTKVPLLGLFPGQPVKTAVTNSVEYDGTNIFLTDRLGTRYKIPLMDTNGNLLAGVVGGTSFNPSNFGTNGSTQIEVKAGATFTNLNAVLGTSKPALNLGSANTSANMYWNEATLAMTNSSSSGQIEWTFTINDKGMGGLRMDQTGTMNWHATNFFFFNQTNALVQALSLVSGRAGINIAPGASAKEPLMVSGNALFTNSFMRFWVVGASPTSSNFQAQVYTKTNAATAANELFAMNDAGNESILTGTVTNIFKGSGALDFGSTLANTNADLTLTITGAADGDPVALGTPNASIIGGTTFTAWVSSANTVTVRFNNYTTGAKDPASGTFKALVYKVK
jgi:hypothetical protein